MAKVVCCGNCKYYAQNEDNGEWECTNRSYMEGIIMFEDEYCDDFCYNDDPDYGDKEEE